MKSQYEILKNYFKEKYDLDTAKAWLYVADELGVDLVYLIDVRYGFKLDFVLDRLAKETLELLIPTEVADWEE